MSSTTNADDFKSWNRIFSINEERWRKETKMEN